MIVADALNAVLRVLRQVPLHPALIAVNLTLLFASGTVSEIEIATMAETAGLLVAGTVALTVLLIPAAGDFRRAALGATVILTLTIQLPAVLGTPETTGWLGRLALIGGVPILIVAVLLGLRRSPHHTPFFTLAFNVVALAFLVQSMSGPVMELVEFAGRRPRPQQLYPDLPVALADDSPDVWNFVMDRYAGPESLQRVYGFDNAPFLAALEQRGFSVARHAAANYQRTAPSLASSLNLNYLTPFEQPGRISPYDELPLYRAIHNSRVSRFFAGQGYAIINAGSWWEPTRHDDHETLSLNYADKPELVRVMLDRSLLGYLAVATGLEFGNGRLTQCRRINVQFDRLEETAASPERKFVFAHILLPHPPYVVTAEGACKDAAEAAALSRAENYVAQVRYANRRLLALLDRILAGPRPAVIILQADEGPWPALFAANELSVGMGAAEVEWGNLNDDQLREKMLILFAMRFPGDPSLRLDDHATPVNAYRLVLNRYFSASYPILPDHSYVFRDRRNLYDFLEVTDALR